MAAYDVEEKAKDWIKDNRIDPYLKWRELARLLRQVYDDGVGSVLARQRGKYGHGICPLCREDADADSVDIGVGTVSGLPYCGACLAYMNEDGTWHPGPEWVQVQGGQNGKEEVEADRVPSAVEEGSESLDDHAKQQED